MSLQSWLGQGWLEPHQTSRDEIKQLLELADRDLRESQARDLGHDWALSIAYNAALQCATAALAACGYRAARGMHHLRTIRSLQLTIRWRRADVDVLDGFRQKRHTSEYELSGAVSAQEAQEMLALAQRLRQEVEAWLKAKHPHLL